MCAPVSHLAEGSGFSLCLLSVFMVLEEPLQHSSVSEVGEGESADLSPVSAAKLFCVAHLHSLGDDTLSSETWSPPVPTSLSTHPESLAQKKAGLPMVSLLPASHSDARPHSL